MDGVDDTLTGRLLVASPTLLDPNFHRTVIFICAQSDDGTFGLVLNRPLEAELLEHVPAWRHIASSPTVIFSGGPVEPAIAMGLARVDSECSSEGWTGVTEHVGLFDLGRQPDELGDALRQVRIFSGHAGWGAGQLEGELAEEAWFVVDSEPGDPFGREPERLWHDVLRRQRGELRMLADFPPDPRAN